MLLAGPAGPVASGRGARPADEREERLGPRSADQVAEPIRPYILALTGSAEPDVVLDDAAIRERHPQDVASGSVWPPPGPAAGEQPIDEPAAVVDQEESAVLDGRPVR